MRGLAGQDTETASGQVAPPRLRAAWQSREFRLLWWGQAASGLGDSLTMVAVGLFITNLTGSSADVGIVLTAYSVPLAVMVIVGGVVADRFSPRRVLLTAEVCRAVLHGGL